MKKLDYLEIRNKSVELCEDLSEEAMSCQPRREVSPPKWHLGHTTWLFEKIILEAHADNYKKFNTEYDYFFNSYYKQVGTHIKQSNRESIKLEAGEILRYREYVDKHMETLISSSIDSSVVNLIEVGLNHEQQHQELLSMDIKAVVFHLNELKTEILNDSPNTEISNTEEWLEIPEGIKSFGHLEDSFSYDNEKPNHKVYLYPSKVNKNLVTVGEYLEFIIAGGYEDSKYWLSKGWDWIESNKIVAPLYWDSSLDHNQPVAHISYFEADAFANWSGRRLPTEFELEIFDNKSKQTSQLWCWSSSQYSAYPKFQKFDGALSEYNGKFMCNQFVLRGGCFATPENHWRASYRNFYEPEQRWMFSGIRLAKDL